MAEGVTEEEGIEPLSRTLTHNLTAEGTPALPEWPSMFSVLINGLAFVPADYTTNSTLSDESDKERAWSHILRHIGASALAIEGFLSQRKADLGLRHSMHILKLLAPLLLYSDISPVVPPSNFIVS